MCNTKHACTQVAGELNTGVQIHSTLQKPKIGQCWLQVTRSQSKHMHEKITFNLGTTAKTEATNAPGGAIDKPGCLDAPPLVPPTGSLGTLQFSSATAKTTTMLGLSGIGVQL